MTHVLGSHVDATKALDMPGVHDIVTAADVPGENQIGAIFHDEEVFASKEVVFHGSLAFGLHLTHNTHADLHRTNDWTDIS